MTSSVFSSIPTRVCLLGAVFASDPPLPRRGPSNRSRRIGLPSHRIQQKKNWLRIRYGRRSACDISRDRPAHPRVHSAVALFRPSSGSPVRLQPREFSQPHPGPQIRFPETPLAPTTEKCNPSACATIRDAFHQPQARNLDRRKALTLRAQDRPLRRIPALCLYKVPSLSAYRVERFTTTHSRHVHSCGC